MTRTLSRRDALKSAAALAAATAFPIAGSSEPVDEAPDTRGVVALSDWSHPPLEHVLGRAVESMRRMAAKAGNDDVWTAQALEQRPLVFVAAMRPGGTMTWLMEPGHDEVMEIDLFHLRRDGEPYSGAAPLLWPKTARMQEIEAQVGWLLHERTGNVLGTIAPID